jgi:hypothetical protein
MDIYISQHQAIRRRFNTMRSWRTKLLTTIVGIVSLSFSFFTVPQAYAATTPMAGHIVAHTTFQQVKPHTASGGGCNPNSNGDVVSCISINQAGWVVPDAYINHKCATAVVIDIFSLQNGYINGSRQTGGCMTGHWVGPSVGMNVGYTYYSCAYVWFGSNEEDTCSPNQNA